MKTSAKNATLSIYGRGNGAKGTSHSVLMDWPGMEKPVSITGISTTVGTGSTGMADTVWNTSIRSSVFLGFPGIKRLVSSSR